MVALQYTVELWLLTRRVPVSQLTCGLDGYVRYCCLWSAAMSPSVVESQCGVLLALQTQRLSYIHETWKTAATKTLVSVVFFGVANFCCKYDARDVPCWQKRSRNKPSDLQKNFVTLSVLQVSPFCGLYHGLVRFLRSWLGHRGEHRFFCGRGCDDHRTCLLLFSDDLVQR